MASSSDQPQVDICQSFKRKLNEWSVKSVCGRKYIQTSKLEAWMNDPVHGANTRNLDLLWEASMKNVKSFPLDVAVIAKKSRKCLLIFSILVEMDKGHLIETFRKHIIDDRHLPKDRSSLDALVNHEDLDAKIARDFDRLQWKYRPLIFDLNESQTESWKKIIPVCEKEIISTKGGTAKVHQICVQEEFVSDSLRHKALSSKYDDEKFGPCYHFALKTYDADSKALFLNETNAFRGLEDNAGMIPRLFNYSHEELPFYNEVLYDTFESTIKYTHNIVLAYGECDLQDYFEQHSPPILEDELLAFWSDLFLVADAVRGIHSFERRHQRYYGWHADIKPDNILNIQGKFKLADPGFARFEQQTQRQYGKKDATELWGGTTTFGAPECYLGCHPRASRVSLTKVSRSIDIWSLGCVFSVSATWVILGQAGLDQFHQFRKQAISSLVQNQVKPAESDGVIIGEGDFFHDGKDVLPDLRVWHDFLRRTVRSNDQMTLKILDLVETRMLLGDASKRISAATLCEELEKLKKFPSNNLQTDSLPQTVRDALVTAENSYAGIAEAQNLRQSLLKQVLLQLQRDLTEFQAGHLALSSPALDDLLRTTMQNVDKAAQYASTDETSAVLGGSNVYQKAHKSFRISPSVRRGNQSRLYAPSMRTTHRSHMVQRESVSKQHSHGQLLQPEHAHRAERSERIDHFMEPLHESQTEPLMTITGGEGASGTRNTVVVPPRAAPKQRANTTASVISRKSTTPSITSTTTSRLGIFSRFMKKPKGDQELLRYYTDRDIIFLVDNGGTMRSHWHDAVERLSELVKKAQYVDDDGMEVRFTKSSQTSQKRFRPSNNPEDFKKAMNHSSNLPIANIQTNMSTALGTILADYIDKFRREGNKARKLTVIVLTDGLWLATERGNEEAVDRKIEEFTKQLKNLMGNALEEDARRLSIQFVQFGTDARAGQRLKRLDDDLVRKGIPDIVDTKPADADDYDILTGSLDPNRDNNSTENEERRELPTSSEPRPTNGADSVGLEQRERQIPIEHQLPSFQVSIHY